MPQRKHIDQRQKGTSLIELITVVSIIAVALGLSLPSFAALRQSQAMSSARSQLTVSLAQLRSTSVMRGVETVLCPSSDGEHCVDSIFWHHGWIAFVDSNRNSQHDDGEPRIDLAASITDVYIASTAGRRHISYRPDGTSPGSNISLTLCDKRGVSKAEALVINNSGRVRRGVATAANAAVACAGA